MADDDMEVDDPLGTLVGSLLAPLLLLLLLLLLLR